MQYGSIPGLGKPVSRIVQGAIMLNSEEEAGGFALLDAVFEQGCNTFDTAHVYGNGDVERVFGRWMNSRGIREEIVLLDKGAHHNADRKRVTPHDITADIFDSLARLKTDYIDLYALHRDDPAAPVGPVIETLNEHQRAGRIRAFGASNWRVERIAAANAYAAEHNLTPFVFSSPHFSLAEMVEAPWDDCISITGPWAHEQAYYREAGMPVFSWSTLAGGWFSGRLTRANQEEHADTLYKRCYGSEANLQRLERAVSLGKTKGLSPAQVALAWVLHQDMQLFPLVAAFSGAEFMQLAAVLAVQLSPAELDWLNLRGENSLAGQDVI